MAKRKTIGQVRLAEAEKLLRRYVRLAQAFTNCTGKILKRPTGDLSCSCLQCHTAQFLDERRTSKTTSDRGEK